MEGGLLTARSAPTASGDPRLNDSTKRDHKNGIRLPPRQFPPPTTAAACCQSPDQGKRGEIDLTPITSFHVALDAAQACLPPWQSQRSHSPIKPPVLRGVPHPG